MKLNTKISDQESNLENSSNFTIKASTKAFEILSKNLYSDPLAAMVRELASNCLDSHIAAGKPEEPFEIYLPTSMESTISFVDYGTGMSKDDIYSIYTSLFTSTKDDSNDFVGAFGLGSKTPFAISDKFTVISSHAGIETTYLMYKNNSGIPTVSEISSKETDKSGLSVIVPIDAKNHRSTYYAVEKHLLGFDPPPKVSGDVDKVNNINSIFEDHKDSVVLATDDYTVRKCGHRNQAVCAKIGPIIYETNIGNFDFSKIKDKLSIPDFIKSNMLIENEISNLLMYSVYGLLPYRQMVELNLPIGSVDITPSRESLSFTEKTQIAIVNHFLKYCESVIVDLINDSHSDKTPFELAQHLGRCELTASASAVAANGDYPLSKTIKKYSDIINVCGVSGKTSIRIRHRSKAEHDIKLFPLTTRGSTLYKKDIVVKDDDIDIDGEYTIKNYFSFDVDEIYYVYGNGPRDSTILSLLSNSKNIGKYVYDKKTPVNLFGISKSKKAKFDEKDFSEFVESIKVPVDNVIVINLADYAKKREKSPKKGKSPKTISLFTNNLISSSDTAIFTNWSDKKTVEVDAIKDRKVPYLAKNDLVSSTPCSFSFNELTNTGSAKIPTNTIINTLLSAYNKKHNTNFKVDDILVCLASQKNRLETYGCLNLLDVFDDEQIEKASKVGICSDHINRMYDNLTFGDLYDVMIEGKYKIDDSIGFSLISATNEMCEQVQFLNIVAATLRVYDNSSVYVNHYTSTAEKMNMFKNIVDDYPLLKDFIECDNFVYVDEISTKVIKEHYPMMKVIKGLSRYSSPQPDCKDICEYINIMDNLK